MHRDPFFWGVYFASKTILLAMVLTGMVGFTGVFTAYTYILFSSREDLLGTLIACLSAAWLMSVLRYYQHWKRYLIADWLHLMAERPWVSRTQRVTG